MKIGVLVGEKGDAKFFGEILDEIRDHHEIDVFKEKIFNTPLFYGRLNRWAFHKGIRSLLRRNDVCFFEWASELLVPASYMPKTCSIITRLHSYELYAWAPKVNWDHVDKIILVSEAMRKKFNDLYPTHAHKTEVVYNAIPLDKFQPGAHQAFGMNLGMLCSFNPRKRIYEVVMVVHKLRQQGYNAKLHLGGERLHGGDLDEYYVAIQRLVEKLKLQDSVIFYGPVKNTHEWLRKIDINISNSYWEGHQVSLVEAMATGCYCLSHVWDGAEEVLPTELLYMTDVELEKKIVNWFNMMDVERQEWSNLIRGIAREKYNVEKQRARISQIIQEVAGAYVHGRYQ